MAAVKWIKIVVDIFDDEKIMLIEALPESDAVIIIWFKLLCLAGKQNNRGVFLLNDKIPYSANMFATLFRRKESVIKLAFSIFEKYGMIEVIDEVVVIPNWDKHQNLTQLEGRKDYMKTYMRERRRGQKMLAQGNHENEHPNTRTPEYPNTRTPEHLNTPENDNVHENVNSVNNVNSLRKPNVNSLDIDKEDKEDKEDKQEETLSPLTPRKGRKGKAVTPRENHERDPVKRAIWEQYAPLYSAELKAIVSKWLIYKNEKRQGYKPQGLNTFLSKVVKKAAEFSDSAVINILEDSMANGYAGATWDKLKPQQATKQNLNHQSIKPNRFCNFQQREIDYAELEKQERQLLMDSLKEGGV